MQALLSLQLVGHEEVGSQVSPGSTTPLPHVAGMFPVEVSLQATSARVKPSKEAEKKAYFMRNHRCGYRFSVGDSRFEQERKRSSSVLFILDLVCARTLGEHSAESLCKNRRTSPPYGSAPIGACRAIESTCEC